MTREERMRKQYEERKERAAAEAWSDYVKAEIRAGRDNYDPDFRDDADSWQYED